MLKNKTKLLLIIIINIITTIISYASLIIGKFESNYGYEYLGLLSSILFLILPKYYNDLIEIRGKVKIVSIIFTIVNLVAVIIFVINSTIKYPHFFWWQNF